MASLVVQVSGGSSETTESCLPRGSLFERVAFWESRFWKELAYERAALWEGCLSVGWPFERAALWESCFSRELPSERAKWQTHHHEFSVISLTFLRPNYFDGIWNWVTWRQSGVGQSGAVLIKSCLSHFYHSISECFQMEEGARKTTWSETVESLSRSLWGSFQESL